MTERPIIFNDEMVQALLDGRKTQTRRVIKIPTSSMLGCKGLDYMLVDDHSPMTGEAGWFGWVKGESIEPYRLNCPHGVPGDRLWVREVFCMEHSLEGLGEIKPHTDGRPHLEVDGGFEFGSHWEQPHYRATDPTPDLCYEDQEEEGPHCRWSSPFYLPRWASRILLEVTGVRVERVRDISEEDAEAEGGGQTMEEGFQEAMQGNPYEPTPVDTGRGKFAKLWDSIAKDRPGRTWAENPWVWVITFKVIK